ncbi:MAG: serine hydrolase [Pseudomonadota bacterium]
MSNASDASDLTVTASAVDLQADSPPPWSDVTSAINGSSLNNVRVIIGNESGILFEYAKGNLPPNNAYRIASASKMLIGVVLFRLVERGILSLDDNPQDYISWWTDDADDPRSKITLTHLLSSVSGFNSRPFSGGCLLGRVPSIEECVQNIYEAGLQSTPGAEFHYGPSHFDVAVFIAESATNMSFAQLFQAEIIGPAGLSPNTAFGASTIRRNRGVGAYSSPMEYAKVLEMLLRGDLVKNTQAFTENRTQSSLFVYKPGVNVPGVGDWRYALGVWRECDLSFFSNDCETDVVISSPGALGWTPWIDFKNGYYGLIAHEDRSRSLLWTSLSGALQLEQQLQPLIEAEIAR